MPVWRSQSLVHNEEDRALMPTIGEAAELIEAGKHLTMLGIREGVAYFSIDLSHHEDPYVHSVLDENGAFEDLRKVGPALSPEDGSILAHARGVTFWHSRNAFCSVCGSPTHTTHAGYQRKCTDDACGAEHFPRTDPAVIMLVHKDDSCLLGRSARFMPGMYSTLAGFVEPGESLEEAVAREVMEEVGVLVHPENVRYWASQPWPFPPSLMLGFHARAETSEIILDEEEMEDAEVAEPRADGKSRGVGREAAPTGFNRLPAHQVMDGGLSERRFPARPARKVRAIRPPGSWLPAYARTSRGRPHQSRHRHRPRRWKV